MALLYKQLSPLHGVWKMEESSDELLGMLEHKADYSSFLERVSAEKRRQERFASRVLLKELLGEEVRVDYHSTGAPFLACVPLYISISHTKDYVAVILDKRPTGIDIEYRSDRILKIRSRFMNPEEEAGINPLVRQRNLVQDNRAGRSGLSKASSRESFSLFIEWDV